MLTKQEIEIEDLKVKLLPDLQKRAEEERKAAELKELEIVALQKQIDAIQETADSSNTFAIKELESKIISFEMTILPELQEQLEKERKTKIDEVTRLQTEVEKLAQKAEESEHIKEKAAELENRIPELLEKLDKEVEEKAALEEEIERLRREHEEQEAVIKAELDALSQRVEKGEQTWWKKFFGFTG